MDWDAHRHAHWIWNWYARIGLWMDRHAHRYAWIGLRMDWHAHRHAHWIGIWYARWRIWRRLRSWLPEGLPRV
jgi:hypothetical protein